MLRLFRFIFLAIYFTSSVFTSLLLGGEHSAGSSRELETQVKGPVFKLRFKPSPQNGNPDIECLGSLAHKKQLSEGKCHFGIITAAHCPNFYEGDILRNINNYESIDIINKQKSGNDHIINPKAKWTLEKTKFKWVPDPGFSPSLYNENSVHDTAWLFFEMNCSFAEDKFIASLAEDSFEPKGEVYLSNNGKKGSSKAVLGDFKSPSGLRTVSRVSPDSDLLQNIMTKQEPVIDGDSGAPIFTKDGVQLGVISSSDFISKAVYSVSGFNWAKSELKRQNEVPIQNDSQNRKPILGSFLSGPHSKSSGDGENQVCIPGPDGRCLSPEEAKRLSKSENAKIDASSSISNDSYKFVCDYKKALHYRSKDGEYIEIKLDKNGHLIENKSKSLSPADLTTFEAECLEVYANANPTALKQVLQHAPIKAFLTRKLNLNTSNQGQNDRLTFTLISGIGCGGCTTFTNQILPELEKNYAANFTFIKPPAVNMVFGPGKITSYPWAKINNARTGELIWEGSAFDAEPQMVQKNTPFSADLLLKTLAQFKSARKVKACDEPVPAKDSGPKNSTILNKTSETANSVPEPSRAAKPRNSKHYDYLCIEGERFYASLNSSKYVEFLVDDTGYLILKDYFNPDELPLIEDEALESYANSSTKFRKYLLENEDTVKFISRKLSIEPSLTLLEKKNRIIEQLNTKKSKRNFPKCDDKLIDRSFKAGDVKKLNDTVTNPKKNQSTIPSSPVDSSELEFVPVAGGVPLTGNFAVPHNKQVPTLMDIVTHRPPESHGIMFIEGKRVPFHLETTPTIAHETAHYIHGGLEANGEVGFYVPHKGALMLKDTKHAKRILLSRYIPTSLVRSRFFTYVQTKQGQEPSTGTPIINGSPIRGDASVFYIWNEWVAYINGAKAALEYVNSNGKIVDDTLVGPVEFISYSLAGLMAIKDTDPTYYKSEDFNQAKKLFVYFVKEAIAQVRQGQDTNMSPEIANEIIDTIRTSPDAKRMRDFMENDLGLGKGWVNKTFVY